MDPLLGCIEIEQLIAENNQISALTPLAPMHNLQFLNLNVCFLASTDFSIPFYFLHQGNLIRSINALKPLSFTRKLTTLNIDSNPLLDGVDKQKMRIILNNIRTSIPSIQLVNGFPPPLSECCIYSFFFIKGVVCVNGLFDYPISSNHDDLDAPSRVEKKENQGRKE